MLPEIKMKRDKKSSFAVYCQKHLPLNKASLLMYRKLTLLDKMIQIESFHHV